MPPRPAPLAPVALAALALAGCAALGPAPSADRPASLAGCYRLDAPDAAAHPLWFRGTPGVIELGTAPVAGRDSLGRPTPSPYRAAYGRVEAPGWPSTDDPFRAWRPTEGDSVLISLGPSAVAFGGVYVVARPGRGGLTGRLVGYTDASATGEYQRSVPLRMPSAPCAGYRVGPRGASG